MKRLRAQAMVSGVLLLLQRPPEAIAAFGRLLAGWPASCSTAWRKAMRWELPLEILVAAVSMPLPLAWWPM